MKKIRAIQGDGGGTKVCTIMATEDGAEFEQYYKEHEGHIVAIQQVADDEYYWYDTNDDIDNIGYEVLDGNGEVQRAFTVCDQNGTFFWGVIVEE